MVSLVPTLDISVEGFGISAVNLRFIKYSLAFYGDFMAFFKTSTLTGLNFSRRFSRNWSRFHAQFCAEMGRRRSVLEPLFVLNSGTSETTIEKWKASYVMSTVRRSQTSWKTPELDDIDRSESKKKAAISQTRGPTREGSCSNQSYSSVYVSWVISLTILDTTTES